MKHVFIVNPAAGKGKKYKQFIEIIEQYFADKPLDFMIHITESSYEATNYSRELAKTGEHIRFYACGGDGTLFEVINGVRKCPNAEVAAIPLGSGNDFIRLFGTKDLFLDIDAQVNGVALDLDLIQCGDKVAINQCSMGLDAEVCAKQNQFKKIPFINAEFAYTLALLYCFIRKMKNEFTISIDDNPPRKMMVLFALSANSRWYGGGYQGAPLALPDDGLLDFVILEKKINRFRLLGLIQTYKRGEHLDLDITNFHRGKKMTVHSKKLSALNLDGECDYVHDSTFQVLPHAIKFVVPSNSEYLTNKNNGKASHIL